MRTRRVGSVQRDVLRVRRIHRGVLYLTSAPGAEGNLRGCAALEVKGINIMLRSEDESATLILGYQALLKALRPGRSIQILIRRAAHDLSAYTKALDDLAADRRVPSLYRQLASAHADHIEQLTSSRPLFASRCFLIVSSTDASMRKVPLAERVVGKQRGGGQERDQAIRLELDILCERYLAALAAMGLSAHRLNDTELAALAASCSKRRPAARLPDPSALAVHAPVQVAESTALLAAQPTRPIEPVGLAVPLLPSENPSWQSRGKEALSAGEAVPGFVELADVLAPAALQEQSDALLVEQEYVRGLAIVGYPRDLTMGYLSPLLTHDDSIEISIHVHMQDPTAMLRRYRRRKAELRASKRVAAKKGVVDDPNNEVAADDVERLLLQVAKRSEMLCEVGLYVLVHGKSRADLDRRTDRLFSVLKNLFLVAHPTTFEHLSAYQSMQPMCLDSLRRTTLLDTMSVAFGFPFVDAGLIMSGGVLEGTTATGEPVIIDDWSSSLDNPHRFVGAVTGAGKSYYSKLKMMRELLVRYHEGLQVAVIDPEGEYQALCTELGGSFVRLAPGSTQHLNPFDLVPQGIDRSAYLADRSRGDRLAEKVNALHALYDLMLSDRGPTGGTQLSPREKGLLDRATYEAYRRKGITRDPATHGYAPPLLPDLYEVLSSGDAGKDEYGLCDRLYRYVEGSLAGTFSAPTDVRLSERYVVFDVRDMSGELQPIGILLIADFMWTQMLASWRPRVLYIDEAWSLIKYPEGGRFLADLARRARKRYMRLDTITQSPELFVDDPHGAVIAGNAATKILKKQDHTTAPTVAKRFGLTTSEQQKLLTLQKPEALLLAGGARLIVTVEANPLEHRLATTNPREDSSEQDAREVSHQAPSTTRSINGIGEPLASKRRT